jgi:hypothetical protein
MKKKMASDTKIAVNVLNKQWWTVDGDWSLTLAFGRGMPNLSSQNTNGFRNAGLVSQIGSAVFPQTSSRKHEGRGSLRPCFVNWG